MPSGGLYLLSLSDARDTIFTVTPSITYFNAVYRKYSKFMMETISMYPDNRELELDTETELSISIPRYGDLLKSCYLNITLPDIYSGSFQGSNEHRFRWIRSLGFFVIKNCELLIGGRSIQKFTGEYLYAKNELSKTNEEKESLNECIGNVPSMYQPEKGSGQTLLNTRSGETEYVGIYPSVVSNSTTNGVYGANTGTFSATPVINNKQDATFFTNINSSFPSIDGRTLKIPLQFFFQEAPHQALPLISLEKMDVKINITLRALKDLYVSQMNDTDSSKSLYVKYSNNSTYQPNGIHYYLKEQQILSGIETTNVGNRKLAIFPVNTTLEATYIYLSEAEQKKFKNNTINYLVKQPLHFNESELSEQKTIYLKSNKHVEQIIFLPKRSDARDVNEWDNFTNWIPKNIPPHSYLGQYGQKMYNSSKNSHIFPNLNAYNSLPNMKFMNENIIENISIGIQGDALEVKNHEYYTNMHPLEYFKNKTNNIYVYSFSLEPNNVKNISGSLNFANQTINALITFRDLPTFPSNSNCAYKYDIDIYVVQYNIFSISEDIGNLLFS